MENYRANAEMQLCNCFLVALNYHYGRSVSTALSLSSRRGLCAVTSSLGLPPPPPPLTPLIGRCFWFS